MDNKKIGIGESPLKGLPIKQLRLVLADGAVTTDKIANGAITFNKFSPDIKKMFNEFGITKEVYVIDFWGTSNPDTTKVHKGDYWYYQGNIIYKAKKDNPSFVYSSPTSSSFVDWEKITANDQALYIDNSTKYEDNIDDYAPTLCLYDSTNNIMVTIASGTGGDIPNSWKKVITKLEASSVYHIVYKGTTSPSNPLEGTLWWNDTNNRLEKYVKGEDEEYSWEVAAGDNGNNYIYFDVVNSALYLKGSNGMVRVGEGSTNDTKELYVCKFWTTGDTQITDVTDENGVPLSANVTEGDYWMFNVPDLDIYTLNVATVNGATLENGWEQVGINNDSLYLDNSNTASPKLYKALNTASGNYPSWAMILIGTGGTPITAKPSWNNASDSDIVTKGAIRKHYEEEEGSFEDRINDLAGAINNIDPSALNAYIPYDPSKGNPGALTWNIGFGDKANDDKANILGITAYLVRTGYNIKTINITSSVTGDDIGLQEGNGSVIESNNKTRARNNRDKLIEFCAGATGPNCLVLNKMYDVSADIYSQDETVYGATPIPVNRDLRIEGGVTSGSTTTATGGFIVKYHLLTTTHSLELSYVKVNRKLGDDGVYRVFEMNCANNPIDHVIVEGCDFTGYLNSTRARTACKGVLAFKGSNASPFYNGDITKISKSSYFDHILIYNNKCFGGHFIIGIGRPLVLGSFRILENTITEVAGSAISWTDQGANGTQEENTNKNSRSVVSCPIYAVGNIITAANFACRKSGEYHAAFTLEHSVAYIIRNTISNFVGAVARYTMLNNNKVWVAANGDDIYFLGRQLYFVDNTVNNVCTIANEVYSFTANKYVTANVNGTFKFKTVLIGGLPYGKCYGSVKYYSHNRYNFDTNTVTNIFNSVDPHLASEYDVDTIDTDYYVEGSQYGGVPENFYALEITGATPSYPKLYELDTAVFSHNTINYPIIAGVGTSFGHHPCKQFIFSHNDITCNSISSYPYSDSQYQTRYVVRSDGANSMEVLFCMGMTAYVEIIGNKFNITNDGAVALLLLRYYDTSSIKLPKTFIAKENTFTNDNTAIGIYKIQIGGSVKEYALYDNYNNNAGGVTIQQVRNEVDNYMNNGVEYVPTTNAYYDDIKDSLYYAEGTIARKNANDNRLYKLTVKGSAWSMFLGISNPNGSNWGTSYFHGSFRIMKDNTPIATVLDFNNDSTDSINYCKAYSDRASLVSDLIEYISSNQAKSPDVTATSYSGSSVFFIISSRVAKKLPSASVNAYSIDKSDFVYNDPIIGNINKDGISVNDESVSPSISGDTAYKTYFKVMNLNYTPLTQGADNVWEPLPSESIKTTIENNKAIVDSITNDSNLTSDSSDVGKVYYDPETKKLHIWAEVDGTYGWNPIEDFLNLS